MSKKLIKKINIQDDEIVIDIIRKSLWYWFGSIFFAVVFLLLPFFLIYPLFLQGWWGAIVFLVVLVISLILIYRTYRNYHYTALIITSKRLIDMEQSGFLNNSSSVILYGKIQDVNYKSYGLLQTIFKIGDINISLVNDKSSFIELKSIKHPSMVVSKIIRQRENYFAAKRQTAGREAIKLLEKIKRKLGEDKFNRLVSN